VRVRRRNDKSSSRRLQSKAADFGAKFGVDEIKDGGGGRKSDGRGDTSMGSVCEDGGEGRARGHRRLEAASGWIHVRVHVHGRRGRGLSLSESKESGRFGMVTVMG
jgi:hypothetical protein